MEGIGGYHPDTGGIGARAPIFSSVHQSDAEREIRNQPKSKKNMAWAAHTKMQIQVITEYNKQQRPQAQAMWGTIICL